MKGSNGNRIGSEPGDRRPRRSSNPSNPSGRIEPYAYFLRVPAIDRHIEVWIEQSSYQGAFLDLSVFLRVWLDELRNGFLFFEGTGR